MISWIGSIISKYREQILYLIFGFLTTVVNLASFWLLYSKAGVPALIANVIAWIIGVLFAYATNRKWVFNSSNPSVLKEAVSFSIGRLATLGMEEAVLWIGIDLLGINTMAVKVFGMILVVIGNYCVSKWFVFREAAEGNPNPDGGDQGAL